MSVNVKLSGHFSSHVVTSWKQLMDILGILHENSVFITRTSGLLSVCQEWLAESDTGTVRMKK